MPASFASRIVAAGFAAAAAAYALTAFSAIVNYAWRWPMFDQYRLYSFYLTLPFPENILQLENGHRPIVPALLRVFEAWCCDANQLLQIGVGTGLAVSAVLVFAILIMRARDVPLAQRCAATLAAVLGIFWLANARMLMHGNESVHAYLVIVAVMLAALAALHGANRQSWMLVATASLLCAIAMFSFGPGIAAFAMVVLLLAMRRAPARLLLIPIGVLGVCLCAYLFLLPGDQGVRGQLSLRPLENAAIALQWISSPWHHAWLATASGGDPGWISGSVRHQGAIGRLLVDSATAVGAFGDTQTAAHARVLLSCGIAGVLAWGAFGFRLWRRPDHAAAAEWVAFGAAAFALATAALIGMARLDYFVAHPGQLYSDRYLVWPSLFWASLLVLALLAAGRSPRPWVRGTPLLAAAVLAIGMWPTHRSWTGWSSIVYRSSELVPIGAWTGVRAGVFPDNAAATAAQVDAALAAMARARIGPFADEPPHRPGSSVRANASVDCGSVRVTDSWFDPASGMQVARIEGWCEFDRTRSDAWLTVVDVRDRVRGLARWSWSGPGHNAFRVGAAPRDGYDGLIVGYEPAQAYRVLVERGGDGATLIGSTAPAPATAGADAADNQP